MNPIKNFYDGPSQRELNARYNRKFLITKNTRWHGQKSF